jgi:hypothetical protein
MADEVWTSPVHTTGDGTEEEGWGRMRDHTIRRGGLPAVTREAPAEASGASPTACPYCPQFGVEIDHEASGNRGEDAEIDALRDVVVGIVAGATRGGNVLAYTAADHILAAVIPALDRRGYLRAVTALRDRPRWADYVVNRYDAASGPLGIRSDRLMVNEVAADYLEAIAEGSQTDG